MAEREEEDETLVVEDMKKEMSSNNNNNNNHDEDMEDKEEEDSSSSSSDSEEDVQNVEKALADNISLSLSLSNQTCMMEPGQVRTNREDSKGFSLKPDVYDGARAKIAVGWLFASARKNVAKLSGYGAIPRCLQNVPSEAQLLATAAEVQDLIVSGKRLEALQYAQEGQFWGFTFQLAVDLGTQVGPSSVVDDSNICRKHIIDFCVFAAVQLHLLLLIEANIFKPQITRPAAVLPSVAKK
ncbi:hypothetical protein IFM89_025282 [Coptis chinensis]|uniref:Uncharacterized protein n=1 Tax=Coptis chinensis TaxID=261450 RepID=A0A835HXZ9_9MAGN|nr:hypothetical protein IFM89_025282 [Coptis chinensis]